MRQLVGEYARLAGGTLRKRDIATDRHRARRHGVRQFLRDPVVMDAYVPEQPPSGALKLTAGSLRKRPSAPTQDGGRALKILLTAVRRLPRMHR